MTIPLRVSGPSGTRVAALALGSWNTWDRTDIDTVVATVRTALDAGVNTFDVAVYGDTGAEPDAAATDMVFAEAIRRLGVRRDALHLAAKGWLPALVHEGVPSLREQTRALLRRQRTDHVDVLVLGDKMDSTEQFDVILDDLAPLLQSGDVAAWAVNNWSAREVDLIAGAAQERGLPVPEFAQLKYGLTRRSVAEGEPYRDVFRKRGTRIQASDVYEGGLIFGPRTGDSPRYIGGDIGGTQARITRSVPQMREAAASLGATVAQLAVAVPLLNEQTANVLIGARTPAQLNDALGAFDLLERHTAEQILAVAEPFWFDKDVVAPDSSWGTRRDDDPATYVVAQR